MLERNISGGQTGAEAGERVKIRRNPTSAGTLKLSALHEQVAIEDALAG